ncbi:MULTISPECIES: SDR family NAD(P)-dependent oxidoreductase [unclassified Streptomyces]|uniref:SDR family NAD(P)-dependent oxidoreductase n=1 Tax=unclassified Streptomyces TaxID=2593676 RepID=UPI000ADD4D14|nr:MULTISPECIES: SDR family NAD(P)-dependent oxidoreductase [unclassified Streptomyces]
MNRPVVVVTGASSGIGRGVARALAARGADLVLAARTERTLTAVARDCERRGGRALVVPTDVGDEAAVQVLARRAVERFGRIDAWVNAAAVWSYGLFEDTPGPVFRRIVDTTLFGQVHAARAVLPQFRSQGRGVLVNIGSLYGRLSSPYVAPYVVSKWGLLGFSEVLRQELRDAPGIAVCTVLPGAVDTPIYRHAANYVGRRIRPLPPVTSPERVVAAVVRAIDRPRREIVVGRTQYVGVWAHRLVPGLYDRLIGPVVKTFAVRGAPVSPHDGTVFAPDPLPCAVDDGWRRHDHHVVGRAVTVTAGLAALAAAVRALGRRR